MSANTQQNLEKAHLLTLVYVCKNCVPYDLCRYFGSQMGEVFPLYRLVQIMGDDSLDTTMLYIRGTKQDLQQDVEKIAWI